VNLTDMKQACRLLHQLPSAVGSSAFAVLYIGIRPTNTTIVCLEALPGEAVAA